MVSEETRNQVIKALADLEEAVLLSLSDLESEGSRSLKSEDISQNLGLWGSLELEIVRAVLKKLKAEGRVKNWCGNEDNWEIPRD